jgi:hypothetical protein
MPFAEQTNAPDIGRGKRQPTPVHPGSAVLRRSIRRQIVSFPSQVPVFLKRPAGDMQWRIVLLYFVRGWSGPKIAARFNVPIHRIREILNAWSVRALELGYVQVIDAEAFAACCHAESEGDHNTDEMTPVEPRLVVNGAHRPFQDAAKVAAIFPAAPDASGTEGRCAGKSSDLIGALDVAIAHCEEWRGEFWMRMATLLHDLRTAVAMDLEFRRSGERRDGVLSALHVDNGSIQRGLGVHDKERVSHAVA